MSNQKWYEPGVGEVSIQHIKKDLKEYVEMGGTVYVGSDSMLQPYRCNFATVIALHDRDRNIARYYFKKTKETSLIYRELQVKILKEVELAIQTASLVSDMFPKAKIELHIDVGTKKKNKTAKFYNAIKGWVSGTGFDLKVKPNSWASSLADSHTKGNRT